jgi:hypothetical protein
VLIAWASDFAVAADIIGRDKWGRRRSRACARISHVKVAPVLEEG